MYLDGALGLFKETGGIRFFQGMALWERRIIVEVQLRNSNNRIIEADRSRFKQQ